MSGSRSFSTSDASEKPERGEVILSLKTVQKMLPLVERIATDILAQHRAIVRLLPEEETLDRNKRLLAWPQRQRRYQIKEELAAADLLMSGARSELAELGVVLLSEVTATIGFPTLVNNRRAYFSWRPGDASVQSWQFVEDEVQRPIPPSWYKELGLSANS